MSFSQTGPIKTEGSLLCRTCMCKNSEFSFLFESTSNNVLLCQIIQDVTGIHIEENDGLPTAICKECKIKADAAYSFKRQSVESDCTLRELYNDKTFMITKIDVDVNVVKIENGLNAFHNDFPDDSFEGAAFDSDSALDDIKDAKVEDAVKKQCPKKEKIQTQTMESLVKQENGGSIYCVVCGAEFNDPISATRHTLKKHGTLVNSPKKKTTAIGTLLNKISNNGTEIKRLTRNKENKCMFCKSRFFNKEDLMTHLVTGHTDTKVYSCISCKKTFLNKLKFDEHSCVKDMDDELEGYVVESLLYDNLDTNILWDETTWPKVCCYCSVVVPTNTDLMDHLDSDHPEKSLRCGICSKEFATLKTALRHRNLCKPSEKRFGCKTCGEKFSFEITLNKHILSQHLGETVSVSFMDSTEKIDEYLYKCEKCNKRFKRLESLQSHAKVHDKKDTLFECDTCSKKFNRKDNLRSHLRVHDPFRHNKIKSKNCLCVYCGRSFTHSSNLIVHIRRHTGEKPYKCDFCGKGFPRSSDLSCHRRMHTGEKPCRCTICGKGFSRSFKLTRHMRVHTGQKPYKCTYCDKAFSQSNDLTLHIRRHTGEKPYICEICGDRFIQGTALQNHRRAHGHFPTSNDVPLVQKNILPVNRTSSTTEVKLYDSSIS